MTNDTIRIVSGVVFLSLWPSIQTFYKNFKLKYNGKGGYVFWAIFIVALLLLCEFDGISTRLHWFNF